ncbi:unnamed protein product [Caenorhabditis auriculariae]|uniref:Uncharacterized protein n=1 Tax=Caenorhabditis auriculariae TaxID=2777116 RepID=A0A8S1HR81_9PELO|nr:unnamed protein product [Caenorhabditis auriculariae]
MKIEYYDTVSLVAIIVSAVSFLLSLAVAVVSALRFRKKLKRHARGFGYSAKVVELQNPKSDMDDTKNKVQQQQIPAKEKTPVPKDKTKTK